MSQQSRPTSHRPKHCHLCGRRLWGRGWVYASNGIPDEQAIVVCRRCQETAPRCDVCGVPMGANHVRLPDGRHICARCHQTAVYDPARALKPSRGQATHLGQKHTRNEDAVVTFTFDKEQDGHSVPIGFYLVADGMGGARRW